MLSGCCAPNAATARSCAKLSCDSAPCGILLRHLGYTVIEASSGIHALELFDQGLPKIDLLLTDMVMPGGIGGKELAEILRAKIPGLPVLYSSGYCLDLARKGMAGEGQTSFLQKPYSTQTLAKAIRDCLRK